MENPKIRMMLCDVDGTLLDKGQNTISNEVFSAIQTAEKNGIRFVIASGRCYPDLRQLFAPVLQSVSFIVCDGGLAIQNDATLFSSRIPESVAKECVSIAQTAGCVSTLIYGKDDAYYIGKKPKCTFYKPASSVDDVYGNIYKIAFFKLSDYARHKVRAFAKMSGKLSEVYADAVWTEFVFIETDKGAACKALQAQWGISPLETAAFGDNVNDFGMLRQARLTFASRFAVPDIIRMCKFRTENVPNEIIKLSQERGLR